MTIKELKQQLTQALESKNIKAIDQHFCDIARCVWWGVDDLEEAKRLDLGFGCEIRTTNSKTIAKYSHVDYNDHIITVHSNNTFGHFGKKVPFEIIGQETGLDRVLKSLPDLIYHDNKLFPSYRDFEDYTDVFINWTLKNKDGSRATFVDQSDETKIALSKLIF